MGIGGGDNQDKIEQGESSHVGNNVGATTIELHPHGLEVPGQDTS